VQWRRVKVSDELPKLTQDYLVIAGTPPATAARGATFNHAPKVLSNANDATFKLDTAPPGMRVDRDILVWEVPHDFALGDVPVEVSVESKLKPNVGAKQRFTLAIVENAPIRTGLFAPKPPEGRAIRSAKAGAAGDPLTLGGPRTATVKRGATYRTPIAVSTPADTDLSIVAGPPGLNWKENDLVWEVPADFPGGPVPVVVVAQTAANRRVALGFLIDVQE